MCQVKSESSVILSLIVASLLLAACDGGGTSPVPPPAATTPANVIFTRDSNGVGTSAGDIYLIKEDGTGMVPLASTANIEAFKGVSPSGRVVYGRRPSSPVPAYDTELDSVNADGTGTVNLTTTPGVFYEQVQYLGITSTGRVIYKTGSLADDVTALHSVSADGTVSVVLDPPTNNSFKHWFQGITPSGRVIWWNQIDNNFYSINADGTGLVTLANSASQYAYHGITPGGRVIFSTPIPEDLYSINADGTGSVPLTSSTDPDIFQGITAGGRAMYSTLGNLYSVNSDGTGTVTLATTTDAVLYVGTAPSGRVIYQRITGISPNQTSDLYSVNADGTGTLALANTADIEAFGGITPGGQVIYWRNTLVGILYQYDLYSINADGTGAVVLAMSTDVTGPAPASQTYYFPPIAITPGNRVIYQRFVGGTQFDLYSVNADGTGAVGLANTADNETIRTRNSNNSEAVSSITPSGRVIYERNLVGGNLQTDIYSVNADGTGTTVLTNAADSEEFNRSF